MSTFRSILIWMMALVLGVAAIAGVWLVIVAISGPVGQGEAYRQKQSANNRVFAQATFEKQFADIQATKAKIAAAEKVRASSPEAEVRYQGLISYCAGVVGEYNAASRSYTSEQFRAADLPAQLDPTIDCEAS